MPTSKPPSPSSSRNSRPSLHFLLLRFWALLFAPVSAPLRAALARWSRRSKRTTKPCAYLGSLKLNHPTKGQIPFELYPYQRALLDSAASQRLVLKARQVGVSQLIAGEALWLATHQPGATVLFVSRNLSAAQHLQRLVCQLLEQEIPLSPVVRRNEAEVILANGSTLRSLPASEDTGRTFAATAVYLDEFAHMPWADRIYQAVAPCAARGGRVTVISTPFGKTNAFYRLWQESLLGARDFRHFRVHWSDCPDYNPDGWTITDLEERRRVGEQGEWYRRERPRFTDEQWAQEYECDFTGSSALVYREFDPEVHVGDFPYRPDWPTFVGQDFGYINPSVALLLQVSPSEEVFVIAEHYHTNRSISELAREVYRPLCDQHAIRAWYCDPAGASEIAELRAAGLPATGRRSTVAEGVTALRKLMRPPGGGPPRLHVDRRCRRLVAELATYSFREGEDQVVRDLNDHGPDALRYFLVNHWAHAAAVEPLPLR